MGNTFMFLLMALNTALSSQEELKTTDQQTNSTHRINVERQRTEVDSLYDEMNLGQVLKYEAFRQAMEGRKRASNPQQRYHDRHRLFIGINRKETCGARPCA